MIQVKVESIRVSLINQNRLVVLQEIDGPRFLAIWIGPFEAEAITIGLKGTEIDRPLTHDLLRGLIEQLDAQVERVVINELQDDTFFARIVIARGGGAREDDDDQEEGEEEVEIDARPSDAIALAVRAEVPIFVATSVMDAAGQTPSEEESDSEGVTMAAPSEGGRGEDDETGLDLFREFFEGLEQAENGDRGEPETDD